MTTTYYPKTIEGRADWWANILSKADSVLPGLGYTVAEITAIKNDANWAIYCYRTLRNTFEGFVPSVTAYANTILSATGVPMPDPLVPPAWPTAPVAVIEPDIDGRREDWVQTIKKNPAYNESVGEALRLIAPGDSFDPSTYETELLGLYCSGPRTVSGKFRKAQGRADGIILRGRKVGATQWTDLGRFTATPFSALVPLAGYDPEAWEFQAQVFHRDVPFGLPSANIELPVRG